MESHIEEEYILIFGNKSIDVSNVSIGKKHKNLSVWNKEVSNDKATVDSINEMVDRIGLDFIKQDYDVLRIRFGRVKSFIEYVKRSLLTRKLINRCNTEQYELFQSWVYEQITGKKKVDLETDSNILEMTREIYLKMETELNLSQEQVSELLMTYAKDQMKHLKRYTTDQKKSS